MGVPIAIRIVLGSHLHPTFLDRGRRSIAVEHDLSISRKRIEVDSTMDENTRHGSFGGALPRPDAAHAIGSRDAPRF